MATPSQYISYVDISIPGTAIAPIPGSVATVLGQDNPAQRRAGAPALSYRLGFARWTATIGAYGSAATLSITFFLSDLNRQGIDLIALAASSVLVEIQVFAPALQQVPTAGADSPTTAGAQPIPSTITLPQTGTITPTQNPVTYQPALVFGGYIDTSDFDLKGDEVTLQCRDYASVLQDITIADNRYWNLTVSQLVKLLAQDANLATAQSAPYIQQNNLSVGHYLQIDHVQPGMLTNKWATLQQVARNIGYLCFALPTKNLYFGPPNMFNQPPRQYTWGTDTNAPGTVESLRMRHSPRRNRTFQVVVNSHQPKDAKVYKAIASQHTGSALPKNTPVYQFFKEGLTQEQCSAMAQGIANDLAKREVVISATIPGDAGVKCWEGGVQFKNAMTQIEGQTFTIAQVTHSYEVPQSGSDSTGFTTSFDAWNIPPSLAAQGGGVGLSGSTGGLGAVGGPGGGGV